MSDTTGLTKDAGWQLGVRRTVPLPAAEVWDFLIGEGLPLWLGETDLGTEKGRAYVTAQGTRGQIRSRTEGRRIRLTWQPPDWSHDSTLQLTLTAAASGTTIGIHQERLASRSEREQMLTHWRSVIETLQATITPE